MARAPRAPHAPQSQGDGRFQAEIQAMMYVFGDVRYPQLATSQLIERILRLHLLALVCGMRAPAHGDPCGVPSQADAFSRLDSYCVLRTRHR